MYPFLRLFWQFFVHRNSPDIGPFGTHVSVHRCWPWDLDVFAELNNGRTLTLYDLGRLPLARRTGLIRLLLRNKWSLTMAGAAVRYRRRIRMFEKFEMRSRLLAWDRRFMYIEQAMIVRGQAAGHIVYRCAVTDKKGIVPVPEIAETLEPGLTSPAIPDWVAAWIAAEDQRPWPPEIAA
ncbi:MAG: thioesterase family protein [Pseudomonadota bacterium]